ncbi:unnamed protein product [Dracunculus medinensis]|uniref:Suf domain-containing protein n=1 Tax=Dracunculus medinensis TaxID=318479 RepID=A0A0N4UDI6_DRAME|nr:unnamed protein product [Dracunculus medinensis]
MRKNGVEEEDIGFEEDLLRNPYSLRSWIRYIEHKKKSKKSNAKRINIVYERALKELPGSYKLWYSYLRFRRSQVSDKCPVDPSYEHVNNAYERALVFMHKMPRIWIDFCEFLTLQGYITKTRIAFDRALRALPITQHERIWPLYIKFIIKHNIPETAIRVYRRCLKVFPKYREDFIAYLYKVDRLNDAAMELIVLVNDDKVVSEHGKTSHQLWIELCELISRNPTKIFSLNVDAIIRQGIQRYSDQIGILWCSLAEYYIRSGHFERARDIYEEAIVTVKTVRDFTQIFDAYAKFVEREVATKMDMLSTSSDDELELELNFARFEYLMDRRPMLLNSVLLRQNPHNAREWLNRVHLYEGNKSKQMETYEEAVKTVDPKLRTSKLSDIWISFAKFYENDHDISNARIIFERGLQSDYIDVADLASVWCEYVEFELELMEVRKLLRRATAIPPRRGHYFDENEPAQNRVYKSLKIWSLYADVEEATGTFESCKAVYERMIDLQIVTPQIILNFANFLEENNYFEHSFKAYEKGIALFKWPIVGEIWSLYLVKFIKRYGAKKLERARDLFEQCLEACPPKFAMKFYLLYAMLEEEHGSPRRAMNIYNRATTAVEKHEIYKIFNIYIKRATSLFGMTSTRPIFERAIEILPEDESREMSMRYAQLEQKLGEIDRARAIYAHCSEICDPRDQFWEVWKKFEMEHGNEETVREMLRVKRSVRATYNTSVNIMSAQMLATTGDSMAKLEAQAQKLAESVGAKTSISGGNIRFVRGESKTVEENVTENPDEINIDDDIGEENNIMG